MQNPNEPARHHRSRSPRRARFVAALLAALALPSHAASVLDQAWEFAARSYWSSIGFVGVPLWRAQSFTAGPGHPHDHALRRWPIVVEVRQRSMGAG